MTCDIMIDKDSKNSSSAKHINTRPLFQGSIRHNVWLSSSAQFSRDLPSLAADMAENPLAAWSSLVDLPGTDSGLAEYLATLAITSSVVQALIISFSSPYLKQQIAITEKYFSDSFIQRYWQILRENMNVIFF